MENVIRYRVWDGEKMWYPEDVKDPLNHYMVSIDTSVWLFSGGAYDHVEPRQVDAIAMLSTGLQDKKGREVWVDDIVSFWSIEMRELTQGEVELADGRFYMWAAEEHIYDILLVRSGEVIGNVHKDK